MSNRNAISSIAKLMTEMEGDFSSPGLTGNHMVQDASKLMTINQNPVSQYEEMGEQETDDYADEELLMAKDFIEQIGGIERARNLLDKLEECDDCLGVLDDQEDVDAVNIDIISSAMPEFPDMPTMKNLASQFNPGQGM